MVDVLLESSLRQLNNLDAIVRIVVLHPNHRNKHLLLDSILRDSNSAYVRLNGLNLNATQLHEQISLELQSQQYQLNDVKCLIFDECDRADSKAMSVIISDLLNQMTGRMVLVGRVAPEFLIKDMALKLITRFVPSDSDLMLFDYAQRHDERMLLEVNAFGGGRVLLNGKPIENWDGALPRALFFYLVDRGMIRRDDIFKTFWPKLNVREATNVFHVTKRKISEILGTDLTVYWSGFYRISPDIELSYDVIQFTDMVQNSAIAQTAEDATHLLERAISLFRGAFLGMTDMTWALERREELRQMFGEALASLGQIYRDLGQQEKSLGLYLRAAAIASQREELAQNAMKLYHVLGRPKDALRVYDWLVNELKSTLDISPGLAIRSLAEELHREVK